VSKEKNKKLKKSKSVARVLSRTIKLYSKKREKKKVLRAKVNK